MQALNSKFIAHDKNMHVYTNVIVYFLCLETQFGLVSANCIVGENQREVYVCVELKPPYNNAACPVAFPFQLHLSMQNNTAGS